jgi:hypothetical protein
MALLDTFQGGIIVYYLQVGDPGYISPNNNGLIVCPKLLGTAGWGCATTYIDVHNTAIGTGSANTAAIVAGCTQAGIAAKICCDLTSGGYSDWYLPSKDELNKVYLQRNASELAFLNNYAGYWSSSEGQVNIDDTICYTALGQLFAEPAADTYVSAFKGTTYEVIAMRSFQIA